MDEHLLQYIWKHRYFDQSDLRTSHGESLSILHTGYLNTHQGPDFQQAWIRVDQTRWYGNVELHVKSSDWMLHRHHEDEQYGNVILHVVWKDDSPINLNIPLLELSERVPKVLLERYQHWMNHQQFIPCSGELNEIDNIVWERWKARLILERLSSRAAEIQFRLSQLNNHWEELFWQRLARSFGGVVNGEAFEAIAKSLPQGIIARHKEQLHQLEALLFGQAGLLSEMPEDEYSARLKKEYEFLRKKYKLEAISYPILFLRMRPAAFPTIRLSQLATLLNQSTHLFSKIREIDSLKDLSRQFRVNVSPYWENHFHFGSPSGISSRFTGKELFQQLLINTIIPILFAYGNMQGNSSYREKALRWMNEQGAERNQVTRQFKQEGLEPLMAGDSQALLELKKNYCDQKRCLECEVGRSLLYH